MFRDGPSVMVSYKNHPRMWNKPRMQLPQETLDKGEASQGPISNVCLSWQHVTTLLLYFILIISCFLCFV